MIIIIIVLFPPIQAADAQESAVTDLDVSSYSVFCTIVITGVKSMIVYNNNNYYYVKIARYLGSTSNVRNNYYCKHVIS